MTLRTHTWRILLLGSLLLPQAACLDTGDPEGAAAVQSSTIAGDGISLGREEVALAQIHYEGTGASATGALAIDPVAVAKRTGRETSFVSVRVADRWLAFNIPVSSRPEQLYPPRVAARRLPAPGEVVPIRAEINLGPAEPIDKLAILVIATARPMTRLTVPSYERQPLSVLPVTPLDEDIETGLLAGEPMLPPPPDGLPPAPTEPGSYDPPPPPPPGAVQLPGILDDHWEVSLPHHANVQAVTWQCATAGLANNLAYLRLTFGLDVPHFLKKGWNGDGTLPGELDALGHRMNDGPCDEEGVGRCRTNTQGGMIDALYGYLKHHTGYSAVGLAHQGTDHAQYPQACSKLPDEGPISIRQNEIVTFDWVCDRIKNGDGVVLVTYTYEELPINGIPFPGGNLEHVSSHVLRVYGCGITAGNKFLRVLDDGQQDKIMGDYGKCTARDGLRWRWWPVPDDTYDLKMHVGGNHLKKIEQALAIAIK